MMLTLKSEEKLNSDSRSEESIGAIVGEWTEGERISFHINFTRPLTLNEVTRFLEKAKSFVPDFQYRVNQLLSRIEREEKA